MRRLLAAAALAWINFTLVFMAISSAFGAGPVSNLPFCCRRDGRHACSLMAQSPAFGPAFQAAPCQLYPGARALPAQSKGNGVPISVAVNAGIASHSAAQPQTEARYRMSYSRAGQKRGPPVSLA
jgi:hypothetical protein